VIASTIIVVMGTVILRVNKMQKSWGVKLGEQSMQQRSVFGFGKRCAVFLLPFITVLREGLEAIVFVADIRLPQSA
jgi:high-affinity iron transporter